MRGVRSVGVVEDFVLVVVVDDSLATLTEDLRRLGQERRDVRCEDGIDICVQIELLTVQNKLEDTHKRSERW